MEIFKQLPLELKYYIMYECNGIQHPVATIIKNFIKENDLFKSEQFKEPNFFEFLKLCNMLKENMEMVRINEYNHNGDLIGWLEYPYDSDSDGEWEDHVA